MMEDNAKYWKNMEDYCKELCGTMQWSGNAAREDTKRSILVTCKVT